jgi:4-diphosphocytidyl-2C-methyl-D-erythritol kinase
MGKPLEEITKKIRAHLVEFPNDKPVDIAALFNVHVQKVYNARENLRRHKMMPRIMKKKRPPKVIQQDQPVKENSVSPLVAELKAEIARLNMVLAYLEKKAA